MARLCRCALMIVMFAGAPLVAAAEDAPAGAEGEAHAGQDAKADAKADADAAPDFGAIALAYAEAMIEQGRDTYGPKHSPLFAAQMTRSDHRVPKDPHKVFPPMDQFGLRYDDRAWGSANAHTAVGLYQLLYELTAETGERRYADAADAAIRYTFQHLRSPKTDLIAWGEELSWMLHYDKPRLPGDGIMDGRRQGRPYDNDLHEPGRAWPPRLWDRAFELAPDGARAFAMGLWNHQVADQKTGAFSRHARYSRHGPKAGPSFPRVGGWMILAWAKACQHVEDDPEFKATMVRAIETIADAYNGRRDPGTDALPAGGNARYDNVYWADNNLQMAIEVGRALELGVLPEKTRAKLRDLASRTDAVFLTKLNHNLDGRLNDRHPSFTRGFHMRGHTDKLVDGKLKFGDPRHPLEKRPTFTSFWPGRHVTTSSVALLMLRRADQLGDADHAKTYRELARRALDLYLDAADPDVDKAVHPGAFGGMIEFMLQAFAETGDRRFLQRARSFGNKAVALFFDKTSPLPKVTSRHDFYEAQTGGPGLALALYRLDRALAAHPPE